VNTIIQDLQLLNCMQLAVRQYCRCSVSDRSKMQFLMECVAWKVWTSSANTYYIK